METCSTCINQTHVRHMFNSGSIEQQSNRVYAYVRQRSSKQCVSKCSDNELLIKSYDEQNERTTYVHIMRLAFVYIRLERRRRENQYLLTKKRNRHVPFLLLLLLLLTLCSSRSPFFITIMLIARSVQRRKRIIK